MEGNITKIDGISIKNPIIRMQETSFTKKEMSF